MLKRGFEVIVMTKKEKVKEKEYETTMTTTTTTMTIGELKQHSGNITIVTMEIILLPNNLLCNYGFRRIPMKRLLP